VNLTLVAGALLDVKKNMVEQSILKARNSSSTV
jgi:hypothetical protein